MVFLFNRSRSVKGSFDIKHIEDQAGADTVLIGKKFLSYLSPSTQWPERIPLSLRPVLPSYSSHPLHALVCWAVLKDEDATDLSIPRTWLQTYGHIFPHASFGASNLDVSVTEPALLSEIVLTALSKNAFEVACTSGHILEQWFTGDCHILRQGTIYKPNVNSALTNGLPGGGPTLQYRLDMAEPVMQGFAQFGSTRFVIVMDDTTSPDDLPSPQGSLDEDTSDCDRIEIDENFLANSVLPNTSSSPLSNSAPAYERHANGTLSQDHLSASKKEFAFSIEPLPRVVSTTRDHHTLYMCTLDLSRVGVLNDDWAIVYPLDSSNFRLVRVVANDQIAHTSGIAVGSPLLVRNLFPELSPTTYQNCRIAIHASLSTLPPSAVPTARTVTVARVASPFANDRTYQPLCLHSLKTFLSSSKHLVKQGDLIPVTIGTDNRYHLAEVEEAATAICGNTHNQNLPTFTAGGNEIVHFIITELELDSVVNGGFPNDIQFGLGKLGCWVDSDITRIIQIGVEHCRVPDLDNYLRTDTLDSFNRIPAPHLCGPGTPFFKLSSIVSAVDVAHAMEYGIECSVLLTGARGVGKCTIASQVAQLMGIHLMEVDCFDIVCNTDTKSEGILRARFEKAQSCSPCILLLRHIEALTLTDSGKESSLVPALSECIDNVQKIWKETGYPIFVVGTAGSISEVPATILGSFKQEVAFEAPNESQRYEILSSLLANVAAGPDVSVSDLAKQTAALVASDLADFVARSMHVASQRVMELTFARGLHPTRVDVSLTATDFDIALASARTSYSESIGAPKIPNVSWDDIGGLANAKADILDTVQLPLEHPDLFADGLKKRSGILLYGPPGTGKTLLAKAVATSCALNFFSVKGPELLNMYIGESEANVRRVFQRARDAKPCIIFFDELDSVAPKRGNHGDSGGVMDRIVSQLLAELDGMSAGKSGADVFVIGATNRPDLLDPALLRPGRFDRMLYLGVSDNHDAQLDVLTALTRKFRVHPDLDLRQIAQRCPFNYTGADFYALCSDAMLNAMSRKANEVDTKIEAINKEIQPNEHTLLMTPQYYLAEVAAKNDITVLVSAEDFEKALQELVPSVSESEMNHYAFIQRHFSQNDMKNHQYY